MRYTAVGLLSVLEWSRERYQNCLRLSGICEAADRCGWLEDAYYFLMIVRQLESSEAVMTNTTIVIGDSIKLVREDGYARDALVTALRDAAGSTHPVVDCVVVSDQGNLETHANVAHAEYAAPMTPMWRRPLDHPTHAEFARDARE
jgi:hypothetical protein